MLTIFSGEDTDVKSEILGITDENSLASHDILQTNDETIQYAFRNTEGQFVIISNQPTTEYVTTTTGHHHLRNISPKVQQQTSNNNNSTSAPTNNVPLSTKRDERRRATHNEVERRRRDKINNWIMKLGKIIPETTNDVVVGRQTTTSGHFEGLSKGGILAKACEYITELKDSNNSLNECLKDNEKVSLENMRLREINERLRRDNDLLRAQISQHGIAPAPDTTDS